MKFQLTVKNDYCKDWNAWEGIRELVSNARDAHEEGKPMSVSHHGDVLRIVNEDVKLTKDVWLMGFSQKASAGARGRFGEGLPVGTLALVRAGHEVKFINDDESWTPTLEQSEVFDGQDVLTIKTHQRQNATGKFTVEVGGIDQEAWDLMKTRFLFVTRPEKVVSTTHADVLLDENMRGRIFVKGIYVQTVSDLRAGYDFKNVTLDRDRRMVGTWDLRYHAAKAWEEAMTQAPAEHADRVVDMLQNAAADVSEMGDNLNYQTQTDKEKIVATVASAFRAKHGDEAIPVTSMAQAKVAEHYGKRGVVVQPSLMNVLRHEPKLDVDHVTRELGEQATKGYSWSDLSAEEQAVYTSVMKLVESTAADLGFSPVENRLSIVDFGDASINGMHKGGDIKLAKHVLADFDFALRVLVHEVTHDIAHDGEKMHEVAEGRFFARMVSKLLVH